MRSTLAEIYSQRNYFHRKSGRGQFQIERAGGFEDAVEFEQAVGHHGEVGHHVVLAEKGAERLNHLRQSGVRAVDDLVVFALGLLVPMPGVLKRLDLRLAVLSLGRFEEEIVVALGVERRVEVDEVHGLVREVFAEHSEVVAVVKGIHARRECGAGAGGWQGGARRSAGRTQQKVERLAARPNPPPRFDGRSVPK